MRSFLKSNVLDILKEKLRSFLEGIEEEVTEEKKIVYRNHTTLLLV